MKTWLFVIRFDRLNIHTIRTGITDIQKLDILG